MPIHKRKHAPPSFPNYKRYKSWLRDEFAYRCVYCQIHEAENGNHHHFGVEHFRPKSLFPDLINRYANLFYACLMCNSQKSDKWPTWIERLKKFRFLNPCEDDYDIHIDKRDIRWAPKTKPGRYQIEELGLNLEYPVQIRESRRLLISMREKYRKNADQLRARAKRKGALTAVTNELHELDSQINALDLKIDRPSLDYPAQLR